MKNFVLTSESVTAGHPDKLCDQICDATIDEALRPGVPVSMSAECAIANGVVFLSVIKDKSVHLDFSEIAREVIAGVGYTDGSFSAERCTIMTNVSDISLDKNWAEPKSMRTNRAVTAFGFACRQTPDFLPYSVWAAHRLTKALDSGRGRSQPDYLLPDGQVQVAVRFKDRKPVDIESIVLTTATADDVRLGETKLHGDIAEKIIAPAFSGVPLAPSKKTRIVVQQAQPSPVGGPANHAGLTGRKTADDGYGGYSRQTAAALSGKDPSRIDRIAAYAARYIAKCVVAADLAHECEVQLSYSIGDRGPVSFEIDTFGSGSKQNSRLSKRLLEVFDLRVGAIVEMFDLWNIVRARDGRFYRDLAVYGHFGRDELDLPWEDTAAAEKI